MFSESRLEPLLRRPHCLPHEPYQLYHSVLILFVRSHPHNPSHQRDLKDR